MLHSNGPRLTTTLAWNALLPLCLKVWFWALLIGGFQEEEGGWRDGPPPTDGI